MLKSGQLPMVSYIIPTLNSGKYLRSCLYSVRKQDYPKNKYEVLVVDGGSDDETREIAKEFRAVVINNPYRDAESAKAIGLRKARGKIIALLDSDNEIVKKDWLRRMVKPLSSDPGLFGVESWYFPKKGESIFNTYSMLAHIADPFSRCLAGRLKQEVKPGYVEFEIAKGSTYPLGANGFLWNRSVIDRVGGYKEKFEESNFSYFALEKGFRKFARVPGYGIYHQHIDSLKDFIGKRLKIGSKFLVRKEERRRTWLDGVGVVKFVVCVIYCGTVVGPMFEGLYQWVRTKNRAWLLHPLMALVSVLCYGLVFVKRRRV